MVGDICRALEARVLPFCDGIMTELLKDLSSKQLHRSVKPPIFSCFGDIALAIGDQFEKYLAYAVPMLQGAAELSAAQMGQGDEELLDYNNQLRGGIFEAYSGLLQGFKGTPKTELLVPYAEHIVVFIETVYKDNERWVVLADRAFGFCYGRFCRKTICATAFIDAVCGMMIGQRPFWHLFPVNTGYVAGTVLWMFWACAAFSMHVG